VVKRLPARTMAAMAGARALMERLVALERRSADQDAEILQLRVKVRGRARARTSRLMTN